MKGNLLYMFRLFLLLLASESILLGADYINSATAPQSVTQDATVSVEVSYQASTYRDLVVVFQINSSPWTTFGYRRISVSAGSSTLNIPIDIDANTPIANGIYKFVVYIAPTSGVWYDRLDAKTPQNSVSCIQAPSSVSDYDSFSISLDGAETELLLKDKIDPIEIIEFSSDLRKLDPGSEELRKSVGNHFSSCLCSKRGGREAAIKPWFLPTGEKGFYRKRSTSTINASSNEELASRFLMQATFGASRSEINSFPNVNSNTFGSAGDDSFLNWIDAQIAISPFYHRAHWRERSDPDYIDESALPGRLVNEVGHNPAYGQQFAFSRGQTVYRTDWTNPLPGYGGLFDINGNVIDENHPDWPTNNWWFDSQGRPMIGLHSENCEAHLAQNPGTGLRQIRR
jgi:hypothetical protein